MRTRSIAGVALAVLAGLALTATSAQAAGGYKRAKFKAEVKGVQTYEHEYDHASTDRCDPQIDSTTRERIKFRSTKSVLLTAMTGPGIKDPFLTSGTKPLRIPVKATVRRSNDHSATPLPPGCPDNGGGVGPLPPPDCGTKVVKPWWLTIDYYRKDHVQLQPEDVAGSDLFERCGNGSWPYLLRGEVFGKRQSAELTKQDLFNRKFGKLITIGRGHSDIVYPEGWDKTTLRWELSLTRLGKKK